MRTFFLFLFVSLLTIGLFISDAEARFGGGRSFGMSRLASSSHSSFNTGSAARSFQSAAPRTGTPKWLGPLAGFAAGGLIASLLMGHGLGSGLFSWLLIGGFAFFMWRLISSKLPAPNQPATSPQPFQYRSARNSDFHSLAPVVATIPRAVRFDEAAFLRQAKAVFIQLQTDYDNKSSADIRALTTPEVFAEIQSQLQQRGNASNQTEIIKLNIELRDTVVESETMIASVFFSGLIREQPAHDPIAIKEIWHFFKNNSAQNWIVAGITQFEA